MPKVRASEAFKSLKYEIGKQNIPAHFIERFETEIFFDMARSCSRALLTQIQPDGQCKVVQNPSRTFEAIDQRKSYTEIELLAIV
jgi:RNase H-like domain found in reverse transcriptase